MAQPNTNLTPEKAREIHRVARELGVDPIDLASVIAYETAHTFSPSIRGGMFKDGSGRGAFTGLIQFSPDNQRRYGVTGKETFAQQMDQVGAYLKDRGVRPGMGLLDVYSAINAGRAGRGPDDPIYNRADVNGTQRQHAEKIREGFMPTIRETIQQAYRQPELMDFARRTELNADVEGLFGPGAQAAPSILDGFNIVATNNMTGLPTPEAKPMQRVGIPQEKPASLRVDTMRPNQAMARDVAQLNADIGNPELYRQEVQRASLPDLPASPRGIGATPATAYEPGRSIFDGIADMGPNGTKPEWTGFHSVSGRKTYTDPQGVYSEKTITVPTNQGWVSFPSIDRFGNQLSERQVTEYINKNGPVDPVTGETFPTFDNVDQAVEYAVQRSPGLVRDNVDDLEMGRAAVMDANRTAIGSGDYGPGPVSMSEYAGVSIPDVAPSVTGTAAGQVGSSPAATGSATAQISSPSRGNTGPSGNPRDAFGRSEIGSPEVDMTAPSQSVFDPKSFGMIDMPTTTAGLLGAIGAPQSVISPQQAPQAVQAPQAAPPAQMPPMSAPRTIAAMPEVMGHRQGEIRTTPGAVPEVAQAVNRYGLNPDPGPGWSYGFSPYGSGISKVHDNAPERVKAAGTGPGLFGAFKDDFGIDLTPSAGVMTAPIAMGLDAAGGGGLFSLANALGASKAGLDRLDVVDRATRDRVDGVQKEGGGFLGGLFSDPVGAVSRQTRNEIGTLGGLFGWGGSEPATSSQASSGGGIFGGIGGFLNDIFGGGNVSAPSSSIGASRGSTGAASARGF